MTEGIDFFGTELKIKLNSYDREGRQTIDKDNYHSTCNPIVLPLNMTELFLLVKVIPSMLDDYDLREAYDSIVSKIYPQLSNYALNLIGNPEFRQKSSIFDFELNSVINNNRNKLIYVEKRGLCRDKDFENITIIYKNGLEITGKINFDDYKYLVVTGKDGKKTTINYEDFVDIKDFYKIYK